MKNILSVCLLFLTLSVASFSFAGTLINGAGATFPYPLYSKWFSDYHKLNPDTEINYQSIGSGGGIRQFTDKTVDFGASDVPMNDEQAAKLSAPAVHIPTALGSVVLVYNLEGATTALKFNSEVVSEIFMGTIKKWDDAKIKKLNPTLTLKGDILVVHRSDGSGTTGVFTDYLAKVNENWKKKVGQGTSVNWPVGLGGKGNEGVAGLVKQTKGSLGYVEFVYAEQNKLAYGSLENREGQFVLPSVKAVTAAAAGALKSMPDDFRVSITNAQGKESYPISSFTYLLVYKTQNDSDKGEKLVKFLKWAVKDGQALASELSYAPLPKSLVAKVEQKINTIEVKKVN